MIRVSGKLEGNDVVFKIEDDGIGMTDEELSHLRGIISGRITEDEQAGFGMANVQKRLVKNYGASYEEIHLF